MPIPLNVRHPETTRFAVYFEAAGRALPSSTELRAAAKQWVSTYAKDEAMRAPLHARLDSQSVAVTVGSVDRAEMPPLDAQQPWVSKAGRDKFMRATHGVLVESIGIPRPGMLAYWSAVALARSSATLLDGVLYDMARQLLLDHVVHSAPVPPEGVVAMSAHVRVVAVRESERDMDLATLGLVRFGIPNLVVSMVPRTPEGRIGATTLLLATAQWLLDAVLWHVARHPEAETCPIADRLVIPYAASLRAQGWSDRHDAGSNFELLLVQGAAGPNGRWFLELRQPNGTTADAPWLASAGRALRTDEPSITSAAAEVVRRTTGSGMPSK